MSAKAVRAPTTERLRVLVVDGNHDSAHATAALLRSWGHEVDVVYDGLSALDRIARGPTDVALIDLQTPGFDGIEVCRGIRAIPRDGYTYVIVQTAGARGQALPTMRAGADELLEKPLDATELEARLVVAARVTALHRQIAERTREIRHDSERAMHAARTDPLTGAGSRLQMNEDLESTFALARRYRHPVSLAILDIDWFKSLNDTRGHLAGDDVIARVAHIVRAQLRDTDAFDRYGGEEFVAILPEQSAEEAFVAIDRVRGAIEAAAIDRNPTPLGAVMTVSAGVAELVEHDGSTTDWLARADAALYVAKESGRNRVIIAAA